MKDLGKRLQAARVERGLSLQQVAGHLGLKSRAAVGHWETGKNPIDIAKLRRLARLYDTPLVSLIGADLSVDEFLALTERQLERSPAQAVPAYERPSRLMPVQTPPAPHAREGFVFPPETDKTPVKRTRKTGGK